MEWTQLVAGTSKPLLESTDRILYIVDNWIMNVREFRITTKASIHLINPWTPKLNRANDIKIMDRTMGADLPLKHIRTTNNWRLFFLVNSLSDMTKAIGDKVHHKFLQHNQESEHSQTSNLKWPWQQQPSNKSFNIWKRLITKYLPIDNKGRIRGKQLGKWLVSDETSDRKWKNRCMETNRLFRANDQRNITVHECIYKGRNVRRYGKEGEAFPDESKSPTTVPTDVIVHSSYLQLQVSRQEIYNRRQTPSQKLNQQDKNMSNIIPIDSDIQNWMQTAPNWKQSIVHDIKVCTEEKFADIIQDKTNFIYL